MMKKSCLLPGLLLIFAVCLSGCLPLRYHASDGGYAGLAARLDEAATNHGAMQVLVVHGIGNHAVGYSTPLADGLAAALKLVSQNDSRTTNLVSTHNITNWLREYSYRDGPRVMAFHEVTWTPTTIDVKSNAFALDATLNPHRVLVNKALKITLMDQALSDAVLYLNPSFRPRMQEPIFDAIQSVARQAGSNDVIVLIASSLGSKMIFDTAINYETDTNVQHFAERTTDILMLANQLPLLHLGSGSGVGDPASTTNTAAAKFLRLSRQRKQSHIDKHGRPANSHASVIHVVAATDPNDLLSYPLSAADVVPDGGNSGDIVIRVSNIYTHNAWIVPWLVENPEPAHDNYDQNSWLIKQLVRGYGERSAR